MLVGATLVTPRAGEILGELVLAIKAARRCARWPTSSTPIPAFNRVLGAALQELAAKVGLNTRTLCHTDPR